MRLDELDWRHPLNTTYDLGTAKWPWKAEVKNVAVFWAAPDKQSYFAISYRDGHEWRWWGSSDVDGGNLYLTPLVAQCVLNHLLSEVTEDA